MDTVTRTENLEYGSRLWCLRFGAAYLKGMAAKLINRHVQSNDLDVAARGLTTWADEIQQSRHNSSARRWQKEKAAKAAITEVK